MVRAVGFAIAMIPLVKPRLPGNSGPADVFMVFAVLVVLLWATGEGRSLRVPYAIGAVVLMTGGAVAGLVAARAAATMLVVLQEIHLLLFAAAVATVARTPRAIAALRKAWVASALGWAALVILAVFLGIQPLIDATANRGTRVHLFFQNPNITGNFFMVAFFVAASSSWPRTRVLRVVACVVLLWGMLLTGSNAAILGTILGGFVAIAWWLWQRFGSSAAVVFVAVALGFAALGGIAVRERDVIGEASESENALIRYSIGRAERSANNRQELFASQMELYQQSHFLGIGPFGTRDALGASGESGVRSSHNDYLATLVERGPLGVLGLLLLAGAIWLRVARSAGHRLAPAFVRVAGTGAATVAVAVAFASAATTHEILHYRHLWAWLGLIAAVQWWGSKERAPS